MNKIAAVSALVLLLGASASAQPDGPKGSGNGPCYDDAQTFCKTVPFGQGRRIDCLASHKAQLKPACQKQLVFLQAMEANGKLAQARLAVYLAKQKAQAAAQHPTATQSAAPTASTPPAKPATTTPSGN